MTAPSLTEFLLARIAEDEKRWTNPALVRLTGPWLSDLVLKMRSECEAKRRIVEMCRPRYLVTYRESDLLLAAAFDSPTVPTQATSGPIPPFAEAAAILSHLALPYADHPDYDEAWRA